jgi:hypothetical protein
MKKAASLNSLWCIMFLIINGHDVIYIAVLSSSWGGKEADHKDCSQDRWCLSQDLNYTPFGTQVRSMTV